MACSRVNFTLYHPWSFYGSRNLRNSKFAEVEIYGSRNLRKSKFTEFEICGSRNLRNSKFAEVEICGSRNLRKSKFAEVEIYPNLHIRYTSLVMRTFLQCHGKHLKCYFHQLFVYETRLLTTVLLLSYILHYINKKFSGSRILRNPETAGVRRVSRGLYSGMKLTANPYTGVFLLKKVFVLASEATVADGHLG